MLFIRRRDGSHLDLVPPGIAFSLSPAGDGRTSVVRSLSRIVGVFGTRKKPPAFQPLGAEASSDHLS